MTPTIIQCIPNLEGGGVERGCLEIAEAIIARNWRAIVVSNGGKLTRNLEKIGATHIKLPIHSKNPIKIWYNAQKLKQIINHHQANIVHCLSRAPAWVGHIATKNTPNCHFITSVHGLYGHENRLKLQYSAIMTKGERIITISHFLKQHLIQIYGAPADKIEVIHRGIDPQIFLPNSVLPPRHEAILSKLSHFDAINQELILIPNRLGKFKGQELLIQAIGLLPKFAPNLDLSAYHFAFVGVKTDDFSRQLNCEKLAKSLNIPSVSFYPFSDDMVAIYDCASLVINCSTKPEGFGRTLIEAGAMEKCVIAPIFLHENLGPTPEIINDGENGLIFQANHAEDLAQKIAIWINMSRQARKKIGEKARQNIIANFTKQNMQDKTMAFYQQIMNIKP